MRRRELMLLLGGGIMMAPALRAQQKAMPVVGYLINTSAGPFASSLAAFHQGLSETGYVEGQNVAIEYRWAEDRHDRLPALAAELVARNVDVIAAMGGTPPALAARPSRSSFRAATRSGSAWSLVSRGRVVTSPASAASI